MGLWKVTDAGPTRVGETRMKDERLLEEHLEDWIVSDPSLLGEPLLVIGRQIIVQDTRERLDVLCLDPNGNAVVVELKRGELRDPVDMQALRYASYVSKWRFSDFETHARNHHGSGDDPEFNFNGMFVCLR